jgi:hypothetical protein
MACRVTEICVDCAEPQVVGQFWAEVLGWKASVDQDGDVQLQGPAGWPTYLFVRVPEPKTVKNRIHLDVNATDRNQAAEVERILALGATRVDIGQGKQSWVVLADPEGNEFCVLRSRVDP